MADIFTIRAPFSRAAVALGEVNFRGEGNATQIVWDISEVLAVWPDAKIVCVIQRPGEVRPYPVTLTTSGSECTLLLSAKELAKEGLLRIELRAVVGDILAKSAVYTARVVGSLRGEGDQPGEPIADILNTLEERVAVAQTIIGDIREQTDTAITAANTATETAKTAANNATTAASTANTSAEKADASAAKADTATSNANDAADKATAAAASATASAGKANTSAANADTATANANSAAASATTAATNAQNVADTVQKKLDAGELKGEKGDQGIQGVAGTDGISPTVTTSKADGVTTVTITDKDGAHTATIEDGADGYSPTATVTKSGTTTTVTVTDKSGTTTAEVKDGSDAAVTKDNIVSALGYEPQEPVGAYELLNTVTTEAVTTMVINKDSDGKTLNLTHMYVAIYGDGTHTGGASVYVTTTAGNAYLYLSGFPLAQTSISSAIWGDVSGHQLTFLYHQYNSGGTPRNYQIIRKQFSTAPYITGLYIYSGNEIAAGMTFKIYGVRA